MALLFLSLSININRLIRGDNSTRLPVLLYSREILSMFRSSKAPPISLKLWLSKKIQMDQSTWIFEHIWIIGKRFYPLNQSLSPYIVVCDFYKCQRRSLELFPMIVLLATLSFWVISMSTIKSCWDSQKLTAK